MIVLIVLFGIPLVIGLTALVLSLLLPFAVKPLLRRLGVIDIPNTRSSHSTVVLRGMGLAVSLAILVALVLSLATGLVAVDRSLILVILAATDLTGLGWPASPDAASQRAGLHGGPAVVVRIGAAAGFGPAIASGDTRHLHWGG